ncbi:hypothetical protein ACFVTX_11965 [Agromyces sp. NPDC058136]|uniref:hypothetical protein n=1 Tax=Agromyces sp. NPDC058136 TaxID=3346354 RepID=UPI0036DA4603
MNRSIAVSARRRPKTSTYIVLGLLAVVVVLAAVSVAVTGDLSAVLQGVENAFDSRQGRNF